MSDFMRKLFGVPSVKLEASVVERFLSERKALQQRVAELESVTADMREALETIRDWSRTSTNAALARWAEDGLKSIYKLEADR